MHASNLHLALSPAARLPAAAAADGKSAAGGSGSLHDVLVQQRRSGSAPLVMLVVALAAGELRTSLDFDGEPRLAVQGGVLSVRVLEVKSSVKGACCSCGCPLCCCIVPAMHGLSRASAQLMPCAIRSGLRRAGLPDVRRQLQTAGKVLVWLLHSANPTLLAAAQGSQLQLTGVMAVQDRVPEEQRRQLLESLDVSCPGLKATMQLELYKF